MDDNERLHLQKMISANNVENNTDLIRRLQHSSILRQDVNNLIMLKAKYINDSDQDMFNLEAMSDCNFLFTYYTDIFNKIKKDEIDLKILYNALDVLKDIEDGKIDQHDGAYKFGMLLRKIYVDSALKKAEKLNADETPSEYRGPDIPITWKQFRTLKL
jgi:hypothetical protein